MLEFLEGSFQFLAIGGSGEDAVKPYPLVEDLVRPVLRFGMPRAPRQGPAGRWQVAAGRGNSRAAEQYLNANGMTDSDRGRSPVGAAEEFKPGPRKITRLRSKWCPVPLYLI